jgi:ribosomal protein L12E/L44/L45/RPP1/RPP2
MLLTNPDSPSEERLKELWSKAAAASDPAEVERLLSELRDVLHEHIEKLRAEAQKILNES